MDLLPMLLDIVARRTSFWRWYSHRSCDKATTAPETSQTNRALSHRTLLGEIAKLGLLVLLALALALAFAITRGPPDAGVSYPGAYDTRALP